MKIRMTIDASSLKTDDVPNEKDTLADVGCTETILLIDMAHGHRNKIAIIIKRIHLIFQATLLCI